MSHAKERLLPTGTTELVIDISENKRLKQCRSYCNQSGKNLTSLLSGPYSEFSVIGVAQNSSLIGVHFKPGGSFPFFKLPADEFQNKRVSLEELWGTTAVELHERLLSAPTVGECFRLLEQMLLAQAVKPLRLNKAVAHALGEFQRTSCSYMVSDVVAQTGLSKRHFIQLFREQVGLTPKLYCRVRRFQRSLQTLVTQHEVNWVDLANACGYFDQAHFINEFRTFSGMNPTSYLKQRGENPNHLPMYD